MSLVVFFAGSGCARPSAARELKATPTTLPAVLRLANGGDTIVLAKGDYTNVGIRDRKFDPPLVIDARAATVRGLRGVNVDGLEIRGGEFRLPPATTNPSTGKPSYRQGVRFDRSRNIRVAGINLMGPATEPGATPGIFGEGVGALMFEVENIDIAESRFSGLRTGISMRTVTGFRLLRNTFYAQRSDGMTIGEGRSGLIEGNECRDTLRRDTDHADCIQLFSRPTSAPTADVVIRKNRMQGMTQGIGMFNHTRDGVDDGGFDRIVIEDNDIYVGFSHGIGLVDARASIVRNNRVRTFPGAEHRATINLIDGDVKRCGNVVEAGVGKRGFKDPPCSAD